MAACPEAGQLGALTPLRPVGDTHMARASCVFGCRFFRSFDLDAIQAPDADAEQQPIDLVDGGP